MKPINQTIEALRKNGFDADAFQTKEECVEQLLRKIPKEATIAFGGSMTLKDMGLYEALKDQGYDVKWHWMDKEDQLLQKMRTRMIYITGTNAITEDGKLLNIDANANRVASMMYGHQDVYIISGVNKIVPTVEDAHKRIKEHAAPLNARRLGVNTPCVKTGVCCDCESPERICNVETLLSKKPNTTNIHVMIIEEELGY